MKPKPTKDSLLRHIEDLEHQLQQRQETIGAMREDAEGLTAQNIELNKENTALKTQFEQHRKAARKLTEIVAMFLGGCEPNALTKWLPVVLLAGTGLGLLPLLRG